MNPHSSSTGHMGCICTVIFIMGYWTVVYSEQKSKTDLHMQGNTSCSKHESHRLNLIIWICILVQEIRSSLCASHMYLFLTYSLYISMSSLHSTLTWP